MAGTMLRTVKNLLLKLRSDVRPAGDQGLGHFLDHGCVSLKTKRKKRGLCVKINFVLQIIFNTGQKGKFLFPSIQDVSGQLVQ